MTAWFEILAMWIAPLGALMIAGFSYLGQKH